MGEFSNEYEIEIERLKKENLEKSKTVSKLFNEKLKAEAEFCSKYERLKSQIKGKSEAEDKIKSLEHEVRELKQDIRDEQGLVESLKESIVSKDDDKAYLEKICEQRKKALDDLAVTSQKEIESKNCLIGQLENQVTRLEDSQSIFKKEQKHQSEIISNAQKQDWQKSREIDSFIEKIKNLQSEILSLNQQKEILEQNLNHAEQNKEQMNSQSKLNIESIRHENDEKIKSLEIELKESIEHNKNLMIEINEKNVKIEKLKSDRKISTDSNDAPNPKELEEAKNRALTAERKMQLLQRDMAKQLNLEKKRTLQLSKKIDELASTKNIPTPEVKGYSETNSQSSVIERASDKVSVSSTKNSLLSFSIFPGEGRQRKASTSSDIQSMTSKMFSKIQSVVKKDPTNDLNLKAINEQLTSLLEDEMMKNKALQDNIRELTAHLANQS